jgi:superkiller protein 8
LTTHTIEDAHPSDIFAVAATPKFIFSGSGASALKVHSTTNPEFPLVQTFEQAHKLGTHHLAAAANGLVVASAGFGGEVRIWRYDDQNEEWTAGGTVKESKQTTGELWAVALTAEGTHLIASAYDGKVCVWDITAAKDSEWPKIAEYETKGSFGMAIAVSQDGRYTASGHENGSVYVFNNDTRRMMHSLPGINYDHFRVVHFR